jgi:hypothetical protein
MGLPGFLGALIGSTEASRTKKPHALVRMSLQAKPLGLGPNQSLFSGGDMVILRHVVQVTVLDKLNWYLVERCKKNMRKFECVGFFEYRPIVKVLFDASVFFCTFLSKIRIFVIPFLSMIRFWWVSTFLYGFETCPIRWNWSRCHGNRLKIHYENKV